MPPSSSVSRVSRHGGVAKTTPSTSKIPATHKSSQKSKTDKSVKQLSAFESVDHAHLPTPSSEVKQKQPWTTSNSSTTPNKRQKPGEEEEKRLRRYRSKPPASFLVKLERAQTQRMIVLGRKRRTVAETPAEDIDIVGSTGNIYTVTVTHLPTCTCPDSLKGNECKHKVYALNTVLKAPSHLQYQLAFLTTELETIFAGAPPLPTDLADDSKGNRKSTDGECPICYMDLDEKHNKLVWCRAQCGHNLHKSCFDQWARSQGGKEVRCVYCRTPWEVDVGDLESVKQSGEQGEDGYLNVADALGLSRSRDYSGYYQPWARRQFGVGW